MAAVSEVDVLALSVADRALFLRALQLLERANRPATDKTAVPPKRVLVQPVGPSVPGTGSRLVGPNHRRRSLTVFSPAVATNLWWSYTEDFGNVDANGYPAVGMPLLGGLYFEWDGSEHVGSVYVLNTAALGSPALDVRYSDLSYDPEFTPA